MSSPFCVSAFFRTPPHPPTICVSAFLGTPPSPNTHQIVMLRHIAEEIRVVTHLRIGVFSGPPPPSSPNTHQIVVLRHIAEEIRVVAHLRIGVFQDPSRLRCVHTNRARHWNEETTNIKSPTAMLSLGNKWRVRIFPWSRKGGRLRWFAFFSLKLLFNTLATPSTITLIKY